MDAADLRRRLVSGWVAVVIGLGLATVIWLHPQQLRVPEGVAYAAAAAFVFAGLAILARMGSRLNAFLAVLTAAGLLVPGAWVAVGPGSRECSFGVPFVQVVLEGAVCRVAFGFGALVVAIAFVALLMRAARSRRAG
jgi:hypothetical protein